MYQQCSPLFGSGGGGGGARPLNIPTKNREQRLRNIFSGLNLLVTSACIYNQCSAIYYFNGIALCTTVYRQNTSYIEKIYLYASGGNELRKFLHFEIHI